jgi:hypothetical protein
MSGEDFTEALKQFHQTNVDPSNVAWGIASMALRQQMILQIATDEISRLNDTRYALASTLVSHLPAPQPQQEPIQLMPEEVDHEFDPRLQRVIDGIVRQKRGA